MAKAKAVLDPARERIREQMEADRRERAARGPVTQGSVAQARASCPTCILLRSRHVCTHPCADSCDAFCA